MASWRCRSAGILAAPEQQQPARLARETVRQAVNLFQPKSAKVLQMPDFIGYS
jgi:hypothetical protein